MPNYVQNRIHLIGDQEEIDRFLDAVKIDNKPRGTIDFNKIITESMVNQTSAYKTKYSELPKKLTAKLEKHGIFDPIYVQASLSTKELDPFYTFIMFDNSTVRLCDVMDQSIIKDRFGEDFFFIFANQTKKLDYADKIVIIKENTYA